MGVTSNHSRPPSRRKDTGTGLKSVAANQKYSTISAAALNQLLQNPTKLVKADSVVAQEKPNLGRNTANEPLLSADVDLRKADKPQKRSENAHGTLPDIFGTNTSEVKRGTRSPNAADVRAQNNVLPEIPVQHVVRPLTPTDEFIHNKIRSKRGSSMVPEDEVQKRLRQKAILQEQIEEKRRQQEREEQERQKKIREDEERIKREIAMLNQRFERERELEMKQANKRLSAPHSAKVSLEPVSAKQLSRPQTPITYSNNEPGKATTSDLTVVENTTLRPNSKSIGDRNVQNGHQTIVLPENANKLADDLQNLTELCRRLMQEQQIMKSELEEQRRQTVLLLQERKANESLKEQLTVLQEQFSLLTPHERATLRIRDHRRKQETRSTTNAVKQEAKEDVAISNIIQDKLKKHATRRRGSWATQSKAIAPAARNSISEPITEGEVHHDHHDYNARNLGEELGCTTKLVYPDDSVWHFDLCEPGVEGERSISPSSRRSPKDDWGSADPDRILSRPGMASNKQSNPKPASVSKRRNRHS